MTRANSDRKTAVYITLTLSLGCVLVGVTQLIHSGNQAGRRPNQQAGQVFDLSQQGGAPISNQCEIATSKLQGLYQELQGCTLDADCNYVDDFYEVLARSNTDSFVKTFDCRSISPFMVTGNGSWIESNMERLKAAQASQLSACRSVGHVQSCSRVQGFYAKTPPVCRAGICQKTALEIQRNESGDQDGRS